ncbi:CzcE family metal-binding protein [Massilia sp. LXY-6]|uniref:CzcE family metal-binding protein n=1 Tax=Massilia sp. LXY-6 TaxID=3379823 RepID=UPI003EE06BD6
MRTRQLPPLFLAAAMGIASSAATACTLEQALSFLGTVAPAQSPADEVITITDTTPYVNVSGGSTVRFVAGGRSFTWRFQTGAAHIVPFDLERIAPRGFLNHRVVVYVADDPLYRG